MSRKNEEKGAITLFVLLACLFFVFILTGIYTNTLNKKQSQEQNIKQIQENYAKQLEKIDEIYANSIKDIIVKLSQAPDNDTWTNQNVTLTGNAEIVYKNQKITGYAFSDQENETNLNWITVDNKDIITETTEVTKNGTYYFWVKDGTNIKKVSRTVKNIDKIKPIAGTVIAKKENSSGEEYEFNTWTDKDIYIEKINGSDSDSGHKKTTYTVLKNGLKIYENIEEAITLSENGTYNITVTTTDKAGNEESSSTYIVKIDKTAPTITSVTTTTNSITLKAEDTGSGIIGYVISTSSTMPTTFENCTNRSKLEITKTKMTQNTTYYIWVKDEVGNVSGRNTANTSTVPANITFTASTTEWTNENVTVTAKTTATGYTLQTSTDGKSWGTTNPITYSANGTMYARLWDGTNAGSDASYSVTNIDKQKPVLSSYNLIAQKPSEVVNPDATISTTYNLLKSGTILQTGLITGQQFNISSLVASDNVGIKTIKYSVAYSSTSVGSGTITNGSSGSMTVPTSLAGKNITITITITDLAGNVTTHTATVYIYTKIEKGVYLMYANTLDRLPDYDGFKGHCEFANLIMNGQTNAHITLVLNTMTFTPTGTTNQQRAQKLGYYLVHEFLISKEFVEHVDKWNKNYATTGDLAQAKVARRLYYTGCGRIPKESPEVANWSNTLGNMVVEEVKLDGYSNDTKQTLLNVINSFLSSTECKNYINSLYTE